MQQLNSKGLFLIPALICCAGFIVWVRELIQAGTTGLMAMASGCRDLSNATAGDLLMFFPKTGNRFFINPLWFVGSAVLLFLMRGYYSRRKCAQSTGGAPLSLSVLANRVCFTLLTDAYLAQELMKETMSFCQRKNGREKVENDLFTIALQTVFIF